MHRHVISLIALLLVATSAQSQDLPSAVKAELVGGSTVYTVDRPVLETTDDATYQTERYGREFAYIFHGLPAGEARLKLGFCENNWTRPGQRVFDVRVNGEPVLEDFDILEHAGRDEALVRVATISIPRDEPLRIEFEAQEDNAKINLVRVYTAEWVLETSPRDEKTSSLEPRQRDLPASEDVWETQLGKLGSRVAINPRPQQGVWWQSPLGHAQYRTAYFDPPEVDFKQQAARYIFGVRVGDVARSLPFDDRLEHFSKIDQTETMTELSYLCASPELPVDVRFTWSAPFYPGDVELSTAPYLTLQVDVIGNSHESQSGEVMIGRSLPIGEPMRAFSDDGITGLRRSAEVFELPTEERWVVDDARDLKLHTSGMPLGVAPDEQAQSRRTDSDGRAVLPVAWEQPFGGLTWAFNVRPGETQSRRIVYVGWADGPVQNVAGVDQRFKYHEFFDGPEDVARYAFENWDAVRERCDFFESIVEDATLPDALKQLLAFATHSYLVNTWWTISPDGADTFTVWEGCCQLQSTVDVEYNIAPFYFALWPELLRMELDQWPSHINDGVLDHDMGVGLEVNGMAYWHPMEIEENTNYVLLLHHYWRHSGDGDIVRRNFDSVRELLDWVTDADTDGDGFPEEGLYNTIDQGSPAIQYAPDQVYLAVRQIAAYQAGAQMALEVGQGAVADTWLRRAELTASTMAERGWLGEHYAVALNQQQQTTSGRSPDSDGGAGTGMEDDGADYIGWEERQHYEGSSDNSTMRGWDSYSIYTTNGLVYPWRSGMMVEGLELPRLREDIRNATAVTMGEFGSPHTSHESNMWVSQNIWRDMAAAYLGVDWIDNAERYWDLQRYINTEKYGAFTDVYVYERDSTSLDYYPRGVAAYGMIDALAGLQFDRVEGVLSLAPLRAPLRIPLLMFADWEAATVPWLNVEGDADQPRISIEGGLPDGIEVRLRPRGEPFAEGREVAVD
ncbi:MAG: malectin domain-containing carbohydrate-binding protein [Armatimonadota bacterium]